MQQISNYGLQDWSMWDCWEGPAPSCSMSEIVYVEMSMCKLKVALATAGWYCKNASRRQMKSVRHMFKLAGPVPVKVMHPMLGIQSHNALLPKTDVCNAHIAKKPALERLVFGCRRKLCTLCWLWYLQTSATASSSGHFDQEHSPSSL